MSSFLRTIQRTGTRDIKHRKGRYFGGRGAKLGVHNPKDPCVTGKKKAAKPWRSIAAAPPPKVAPISVALPRQSRAERVAAHKSKMAWKVERRVRWRAERTAKRV